MELEGDGEITQIRRLDPCDPQAVRGLGAAITVDFQGAACLTWLCKHEQAEVLKLGQKIYFTLATEQLQRAGKKAKRIASESSST